MKIAQDFKSLLWLQVPLYCEGATINNNIDSEAKPLRVYIYDIPYSLVVILMNDIIMVPQNYLIKLCNCHGFWRDFISPFC